MNIVCSHIVYYITQRRPGVVTLTFFNSRGEKQQEQVLADPKLFPIDLKVGDEVRFCKVEKQGSNSSELTKALPSMGIN